MSMASYGTSFVIMLHSSQPFKNIGYLHTSHFIPSDCGIRLSLTSGVCPIACKIFGRMCVLSCLRTKPKKKVTAWN